MPDLIDTSKDLKVLILLLLVLIILLILWFWFRHCPAADPELTELEPPKEVFLARKGNFIYASWKRPKCPVTSYRLFYGNSPNFKPCNSGIHIPGVECHVKIPIRMVSDCYYAKMTSIYGCITSKFSKVSNGVCWDENTQSKQFRFTTITLDTSPNLAMFKEDNRVVLQDISCLGTCRFRLNCNNTIEDIETGAQIYYDPGSCEILIGKVDTNIQVKGYNVWCFDSCRLQFLYGNDKSKCLGVSSDEPGAFIELRDSGLECEESCGRSSRTSRSSGSSMSSCWGPQGPADLVGVIDSTVTQLECDSSMIVRKDCRSSRSSRSSRRSSGQVIAFIDPLTQWNINC